MKCLVTGASGFLGRHLVRQLRAQDHTVRALVRRDVPELAQLGAEVVYGDVLDPASLEPAIAGADCVIHAAGRVEHTGDPTPLYDVHVDGTRHVLQACEAAHTGRVIHVSTSGTIAVQRTAQPIPTEQRPYATQTVRWWPYYLSKIYAEKLAFEFCASGLPVVVLNPSLLLGPGAGAANSGPVVRFLRDEVLGVPPGGVNFIDVRDAAAAIAQATTRGEVGQRYLLGGSNMTFEAFFVALAKVAGRNAPAARVSHRANDATASALGTLEVLAGYDHDESTAYSMAGHFWYLDAARARRELGLETRSPEHTLRDAVEWLRARGPLPRTSGVLGATFRGLRRVLGGTA